MRFLLFRALPTDPKARAALVAEDVASMKRIGPEGLDIFKIEEIRYGKDNALTGTRIYCAKAGNFDVAENADQVSKIIEGK